MIFFAAQTDMILIFITLGAVISTIDVYRYQPYRTSFVVGTAMYGSYVAQCVT